jgi:hypothetical protein
MLFEFMNGGLSYDSATVIANTSNRLPLVLLISTLAFIGGFIQMIAAIWIGFKHKSHGVPLLCVTWFFAHDTTYFLNYQNWFQDGGFWMSQGAWFQMGFYMICEIIVMYQIMRFSRDEVFPGMGFYPALISLVSLQVFAFALFWWFMSMINDPLYLFKFASTSILSPVLLIPMMRARGTRKGFNRLSVGAVALLAFSFWPWLFVIEPYFLQPITVIVAIGNMAIAVAAYRYFLTLPDYRQSTA